MAPRAHLSLALASAVGTLLAAKLVFRATAGLLGVDTDALVRFRELVATGGDAALYQPRAHVLYARPRGQGGINQLGFNDREHPVAKPQGLTRVACLGGSTTEGGNPLGRVGSYPYLLETELAERTGELFETLNLGMSGWTSAEIMIHYFLVVQDYAPDVVVLHLGANDVEPRSRRGFRSDYSHYRRPWRELRFSAAFKMLVGISDIFAATQLRRSGDLSLASRVSFDYDEPYLVPGGRPPPETSGAFRRNVRTIVEHVTRSGGTVVLATVPFDRSRAEPSTAAGIDEHNQILRELGTELETGLADLGARHLGDPSWMSGEFLDVVHVSPTGNEKKAAAIADVIVDRTALAQPEPEASSMTSR